MQNVKAIPGVIQHALVTTDIDKKKIRNVVRITCTDRRKINLLRDLKIRNQFEEKVITFFDIGVPNLWRHFKDWILKACDEVCGKKK